MASDREPPNRSRNCKTNKEELIESQWREIKLFIGKLER
jgi:hypothetical protein